jgi:hypothetical protein
MTSDVRMFNSINTNDSNVSDSITFGDNGKDATIGVDLVTAQEQTICSFTIDDKESSR